MARIWLSSPAPIAELVKLALADPASGYKESDGNPQDIAASTCELLASKAEMLAEYVGIEIENDSILSIPQLLEAYIPPLNALPLFLLRLASHVDWTAEEPCFDTLAHEIARMYRVTRLGPKMAPDATAPQLEGSIDACSPEWTIQHVLLPSIRRYTGFSRDVENRVTYNVSSIPM